MAGDTLITIVGNLTSDPELRFTREGNAVCNLTIASTPRAYDRDAQEWKDAETLFLRANIWREAAQYAADSLSKGMRVIAQGKLKSKTFDTKEGDRRTVFELDIEDIGPSLRHATAAVTRQRKEGSTGTYAGNREAAARQDAGGRDWGGWENTPGDPPF